MASAVLSGKLLEPLTKQGIERFMLGFCEQPGLLDYMLVGAKGDGFHTNTVYTRFVYIPGGVLPMKIERPANAPRMATLLNAPLQAILCQADYCGGILDGG